MDIATIAAAAVQFLIPYLKKVGEGAAGEVGKKIANAPSELYELVKSQFSGHAPARRVLETAKVNPDDSKVSKQLATILEKMMSDDRAFCERIHSIVEKSRAEVAQNQFTTNVKGSNNKVGNFGTVHGDVSF
jgi:hypothetical protein